MIIEKVRIQGFRNYADAEILLKRKTLLIGANDVGKTNFVYALRLLFDKSLSEHDLELAESDYNAYTQAQEIIITAYLADITEGCLISALDGSLKDGKCMIRYTNSKNGEYAIYTGYSENTMAQKTTRTYIRYLNMQCVDTNRDLFSFLRRERNNLLQLAKAKRPQNEEADDTLKLEKIQKDLNGINDTINSLAYVKKSLEDVNSALSDLSVHNDDQEVKFVAGESDAGKMLDNLALAFSTSTNPLTIGGDGRNNQIFLATWIAKQNNQRDVDHVTFYAIEEPEAHLHPHQQRKLSKYISEHFQDQIFITSHSPNIAAVFDPASIVRLYAENKITLAASGGCSSSLTQVISDFGYRRNALSSELFFADGVFLVEGTSEVLLYKAVAEALELDLDGYNISIISVEGVGFKPYVAICDALQIPWVLRTDNDIFAIPKTKSTSNPTSKPTEYHYAGISRVIGIIKFVHGDSNPLVTYFSNHENDNKWDTKNPPSVAKTLNSYIRQRCPFYHTYLSEVDLENDLAKSPLKNALKSHYGCNRANSALVKQMQKRKAENMLAFLEQNKSSLALMKNNRMMDPIMALIDIVEKRVHPNNGTSKGTNSGTTGNN